MKGFFNGPYQNFIYQPNFEPSNRVRVELSFVAGHYRKGCRFSVRDDPQIVVTNRRPFGFY
jgi:hypothetical protein